MDGSVCTPYALYVLRESLIACRPATRFQTKRLCPCGWQNPPIILPPQSLYPWSVPKSLFLISECCVGLVSDGRDGHALSLTEHI